MQIYVRKSHFSQLVPFPWYPSLQKHLYEPAVFVHHASSWQSALPLRHSLKSEIKKDGNRNFKFEYHLLLSNATETVVLWHENHLRCHVMEHDPLPTTNLIENIRSKHRKHSYEITSYRVLFLYTSSTRPEESKIIVLASFKLTTAMNTYKLGSSYQDNAVRC